MSATEIYNLARITRDKLLLEASFKEKDLRRMVQHANLYETLIDAYHKQFLTFASGNIKSTPLVLSFSPEAWDAQKSSDTEDSSEEEDVDMEAHEGREDVTIEPETVPISMRRVQSVGEVTYEKDGPNIQDVSSVGTTAVHTQGYGSISVVEVILDDEV